MRKGRRNSVKQQRPVTYRPEELERRMLLSTAIAAFAPQITFGAGVHPRSVATADVNGDGKLDLIVANAGGNSLSVMLGNGNGSFGGQAVFSVGASPYSVTTADVNRDGKIDLIASNNGGNSVSVLLGNGNGTFLSQQTFGAGSQARFVASGDVNGDGKPDVVVANYGAGTVSILLGNGNGTFGSQTTFGAGAQAASISISDLNRDGKLDLAVADKSANTVSILLGNGNGSFGTRATFGAGNLPFSVASGDVNGDGKLDLVLAEESSNSLGVLLGNGNGTFGNQTTIAAGTLPVAVVISDVNGDGKLDIAAANYTSNLVSVLLGNGNGSFAGQKTFATGTAPFNIAAADVNKDGRVDLLVANGNVGGAGVLTGDVPPYVVSINRSNPSSASTSATNVTYAVNFSEPVTGVDSTDFALALSGVTTTPPLVVSGSGAAYTVTVNGISGNGTLGLNLVDNGSIGDLAANPLQGPTGVSFQLQQTFSSGSETYSVTTADLNGDGKPDLAVANSRGGDFASVLLGNGNGTFRARSTFSTGSNPKSVMSADVNSDGKLDLLVGAGASVSVLLGNGDGTFAATQTVAAGASAAIAVADLNGDGIADLAVTNSTVVGLLFGNGNGTFQAQRTFSAGTDPSYLVALDLNRDGKVDLAIANGFDHDLSVMLGNGNGTFQLQSTYATGTYDTSFAAGDINGDGKVDLVVGNNYFAGPGSVSVLLGNGNGTFGAQLTFAAGSGPKSVVISDLNNDGNLDVAVANSGNSEGVGSSISVFPGNGDGTLAAQQILASGLEPFAIAASDLNGDGKPDLVTANFKDNDVSTLLGSATAAGFTGQLYTVTPPGPTTYVVQKLAQLGTNQSGAMPQATLTMDAAGNLYGTTQNGGAFGDGTVFMIAKGSSTITALASFNGVNGANPFAGVAVDTAGNIFGTTISGGDNNYGTVFELAHNSSTLTVLKQFDASDENILNGADAEGTLSVDSNGNLYGTTPGGGSTGTVFKIAHDTLTVTTIARFDSRTGVGPGEPDGALVIDSSGNIFGTAAHGGANGDGAVFEIKSGDQTIYTLASFNDSNGNSPISGLVSDANRNLYGTTEYGGTAGQGVIFELPRQSGTITALVSFTGANGEEPFDAPVLDSSGNLYGTTSGGFSRVNNAYPNGTVYKLPAGSSTLTTLAAFNGSNGAKPRGGLVFDSAGNLFGATTAGGVPQQGVVFKLAAGATATTNVATFDAMGTTTGGQMFFDTNGNLYGVAEFGGASGNGTVFEIPNGSSSVITLESFNGANGSEPMSLVRDAVGNLFGTAGLGGSSGYGDIFEIPANTTTIVNLASFNFTNGAGPEDLIIDSAGNLYGLASNGGASGFGTLFELPKGSSTISILTSFDAKNANPFPGLVRDSAGSFFGTSRGLGGNNPETIFKLAAGSSTIATYVSLQSELTGWGLTVDSTGNMYGATSSGVFELVHGGGPTIAFLARFAASDGQAPGKLVLDASGDVFGATTFGGDRGGGTIFEVVNRASTITTLDSLNGIDGQFPANGIAIDPAGNIYASGTGGSGELYLNLSAHGAPGGGTLFRMIRVPSVDMINGTGTTDTIVLSGDPDTEHIDWTGMGSSGIFAINDPNGLTINGNGGNDVITLDYSHGNPLPNTLHLNGTFTINGLQGTNPLFATTLEIGQSTVYVSYAGGPSPAASILAALGAGYNSGAWNGSGAGASGAITSTVAAAGAVNVLGIGYADSADGIVVGQPGNTVEIRYTVMGDANLDRVVNSTDAVTMARNYLIAGKTAWDLGNFNYDTTINLSDATVLQKNFNATATGSVVAAAGTTATAAAVNAGETVSGQPSAVTPAPIAASTPSSASAGDLADSTQDSTRGSSRPKRHGKNVRRP